MARMTKSELRARVDDLADNGCDLSISWAFGRPRVYKKEETYPISDRLRTGEMAIWLDGYVAGLTR